MNVIRRGSSSLGVVLGCKKNPQPQKITVIALDGTPYMQNTGTATDKRIVYVYCDTEAKRIEMDDASNDGALISVEWRDDTLLGFIEDKISWREWKDEHGVGKFSMIVKEVVTT
jgi:hypothetical protein